MRKLYLILAIGLCCIQTNAQQGIAFQHLTTSNGLSYNGVKDMSVDLKGNVWIATGNGLNMFNGKTVEKYFVAEYPQFQNNNVIHVTCDSSNRIWVLTAGGNVTMMDEKRQLHRVGLYDSNKFVKTRWILNSQKGGIILFTAKGHFLFNKNSFSLQNDSLSKNNFSFLSINGFDSLQRVPYRQVFRYDDDSYIFGKEAGFHKVNYTTRKLEKSYPLIGRTLLIKWENSELLLFNRNTQQTELLNLETGNISLPFKGLKDQFGKEIKAYFLFTEKAGDGLYVLTTFNSGIYLYNTRSKKIYNYSHNIADPASISNGETSTLAVNNNGWIFVTSNPSGINYFNHKDFIGNQTVFQDAKGNGFDGYIAGIATRDNNTYYLGTREGLMEWKRASNTTIFINYPGPNDGLLLKKEEVINIVIDDNERIWASTSSQGIFVIDKNRKLLKHFKYDCTGRDCLRILIASYMRLSPTGDIWACGANGICKINTNTFEVTNFNSGTLAQFATRHCTPMLFTDKDNLWLASTEGLYHYNLISEKIEHYSTANGLVSNVIFALNADSQGNIYIGTITGLNILYTDGRIKTFTQKNGLLIDRAEGLLLDRHNRMWIGNDIGLACYNIADSSLTTFDERYGLSIYGFRVNSYYQAPNGEFVFGTPRGIQYFHPDSLFNKKISLNVLISKIETKNIVSNITETSLFHLSPADNQVNFYFSSVDYAPHVRTYYEYRLEGLDKDWIKIADQNVVRYNSLPPGKYVFKVKISNDNKTWQDAENEVTVIIAAPIYKTWWFKLLGTLLGIALILYVANYYRNKQIEKQSSLETELVITYFASQINQQSNADDLLWDVARNCISKLQFEDCVIYLKDDQRKVLVQKAAYGPKSPVDFTIQHPIDIPFGKGIVGTVAATGNPLVVGNTTHDERYIVDDTTRLSEIAVPIIINDKVIGVIDSEHAAKNFFTARHLSILSTIAVLCANQLQRIKSEEEKQHAKIEVLENRQKITESRLQSLRLQMNPHFLFNALNSIQQMILANEEMVATRYLSRFSKLLRAILIHSDKETVSLKEELEIIQLYVELEAIRFKDSFKYKINFDTEIDTDEIKIPTLLVQPFVENAIWHGLMHKEGNKMLLIEFIEKGDFIQCIIEDNGVGRQKAAEINGISGRDKKHKSKGIEVSVERLSTLRNAEGKRGMMEIKDLKDENGNALGTRVEINIPI